VAEKGRSRPEQAIRIHGSRRRGGRYRSDRTLRFEARLRVLVLVLAASGMLIACGLLIAMHASRMLWFSLLALWGLVALIVGSMLVDHVIRPLQTLSNVVSALRENDYAFRARGASTGDAMGELAIEVNALADMLQEQRAGALEAAALLRRVVSAMDAPVLAFDPAGVLRLMNPAAEQVFALPPESSVGTAAQQLGLSAVLDEPDEGIVELEHDGRGTRWMVHRSSFRQRGVPHTLLVLSDVSAALREEERQAWRRLIRVLGHEINNSLAPIKSIAGSLRSQLLGNVATDEDLERGLHIVESRAESLQRFVQAYRQLAQLPPPRLQKTELRPLLERTLALEQRLTPELAPGPELTLTADPDQLEQMLINLVRNAAEAALAARTRRPLVRVGWQQTADSVVIEIDDNGAGIANQSNLFVPFYTTKSGGSGVGLALARQIVEAHGGSVTLANRQLGGARATVTLPRDTNQSRRS
jgi:nitrogen fixation/metabolism regulation signal transduction histidine kinase